MPLSSGDLQDLEDYKKKCDKLGIKPKAVVRKLVVRLANNLGNPGPTDGQMRKFLRDHGLWDDPLGDGNLDPT